MNPVRVLVIAAVALLAVEARAADTYKVDPVHSSVIFRVGHAGIGIVYGQFREASGTIALDEADLSRSSFDLAVKAASVESRNEKRDAHLMSPDFLNVKQYPAITFKSTAVKQVGEKRMEVTGDFTLHGVTKSITVPVDFTGKGEFPKGTPRIGIETVFEIRQSDYQIKGIPGGTSDEVRLMVAMEATR